MPAGLQGPAGHRRREADLRAYRELLDSPRSEGLPAPVPGPAAALGQDRHQGPRASDVLYLEALAAPDTINTVPEATLLAFADHGPSRGLMPADGGDAESVLADFRRAGIDVEALAEQLQREGAEAFVKSWNALLERIAAKSEALAAS